MPRFVSFLHRSQNVGILPLLITVHQLSIKASAPGAVECPMIQLNLKTTIAKYQPDTIGEEESYCPLIPVTLHEDDEMGCRNLHLTGSLGKRKELSVRTHPRLVAGLDQ